MVLVCLGDVHSNFWALTAVLEYAERLDADGLLFLGDYVTDLPEPERSMDLLYATKDRFQTRFIRGNRDEYMLFHAAGESPYWRDSTQFGALQYTFERLRERDLAFFQALPIAARIEIPGTEPFAICHAAPKSSRQWIFEREDRMRQALSDAGTGTLIAGHTHRQGVFSIEGGRVLFTGSVGVAIGCPGMAQCLLLRETGGGWEEERKMIPYDVQTTLRELRASELYSRGRLWSRAVELTLMTGRNATSDLVDRTLLLARRDGAEEKDGISEDYWEKAAGELGIC